MSRPSLPTPCPTGLRRFSAIDNTAMIEENNTENIEYTRAFQSTQPRRRSMMFSKPASKAPSKRTNNLGDLREGEEELCLSQHRPLPEMKKTLLGKPAQRMMVRKSIARQPEAEIVQQETAQMNCRTSGIYGAVKERDMRRRTMFIPDDTTVLTIHPGANNTTHRLDDTFQLGLADLTLDSVGETSGIKKPMRRPRKSLAVAPKRIPLGQMQGNSVGMSYDGPGADTGKENQSPERPALVEEKRYPRAPLGESAPTSPKRTIASRTSLAPRQSIAPRQSPAHRQPIVPQQSAGAASRPTIQRPRFATSVNLRTAVARNSTSPPALKLSGLNEPHATTYHSQTTQISKMTHARTASLVPRRGPIHPPGISLKDTMSSRRSEMRAARINQYPVLSDNLAHPELYEDKWLSHQEVALTHIINEIFSRAGIDGHQTVEPDESLRSKMVKLYDQPLVADLHQHLHASVQFGALKPSLPSEFSPDVTKDIGLRKRFINLFVKNYEESALRAAAEVVVGRQMPPSTRRSMDSDLKQGESILDPHADRRTLIGFLETFFVHCADVEQDAADMSREKKGLQRSLMLVWLLDHAKTAGVVRGLLFTATATSKSSLTIIQELGRILLPATPDIPKALKLMGYGIEHAQAPLDEMVYHVDNLAVDLRDGMFVTKLVELSLSPTYQLPYDELKVPCFGHAAKMHNAQIALNALQTAHLRAGIVPVDVTSADIVDGHREKTLMLIWSIVGQYGLSQLVDWRELCADIRRAGGDIDTPTGGFSREDQEVLLQSWAAVHAIKQNVEVTNLTTSFATGKAYTAILSAFTSTTGSLEQQLNSLAFPATWTKHLLSTLYTVPNQITTLSNLAFLASRLLPLSRRARAASTIQRVFRARRERMIMSQRIALLRVARDCATVVRAQQQVVGAAVVLQRAWRAVIAGRVGRLERDVITFQAAARGWFARRGDTQRRIMGGW